MTSELPADLIARRYRPESLLGRGGAGEVFRVRDSATGNLLALKRLRVAVTEPKHAEVALLFEREFHALAQLAHPGIVEVYDYGLEDGTPFYTMELLDGSDLRELAPLPWRRACALLSDVASSLSLLHSRRLVHRDLTPRNVRCTSDDRAKLLDFGAMAAMGPCRSLVGTPGYVAPEQANGQELDARADLFSFGALAYWTLTGRHAYRARSFKELTDAWRTRPQPPSAIVADVPPDLDALVMSLLNFDPTTRPSSAAEVLRRLRALSGQADATLEVAQAYLTTPTLVGRGEEQLAFRKLAQHAVRGRGGSVLIESAPGMGRSRLLSTLVLEAKLAGALVLPASASETLTEDFRLVRELVSALLEAAPTLARDAARRHRAALAAVLPELGFPVASAPTELEVLDALIGWFEAVAHAQPLCIAIDDLARADANSTAFVARLAVHARLQPIVVAATAEHSWNGAPNRALEQLAASSRRFALGPLDGVEIESLLRSVFGAVPNLATLATFLHSAGGGSPGSCLELAQHMVDRGIVRLADGVWSLPHDLESLSLPSSFEQALEQRFASLTACARELAQLLSLATPFAPLSLPDHLELLAPSFGKPAVFQAVDELLRVQFLVEHGERHALRDGALRRIIDKSLDPDARRAFHARLARHYGQNGSIEMVVVYHLLYAGEWERGLAIHGELRAKLTDISNANALFDRTAIGIRCLEHLYEEAREHGRSPAQLYPLQKHLLQLAAVCDPTLVRYAEQVLPRLCEDSGFVHFATSPELAPLERIVYCIGLAEQRRNATPENERGLAPGDAIRELSVVVGILTGVCSRTADVERVSQLAPLLAPFVPLAPAIELLHEMVLNSAEAMRYGTDVRARRQLVIDRLAEPVAGIDEVTRHGARCVLSFYQGLDFAIHADPVALTHAELLDTIPNYAALAAQIRVLYYRSAGDLGAAQRAAETRDSQALLHIDADTHLTPSLFYEGASVLLARDVVAAKRLADTAEREAARFPGWRTWHSYSVGLYEMLRGDLKAARAAIARCLDEAPATGHAAAVQAMRMHIELLAHEGEAQRAVDIGRALLAQFEIEGRPLVYSVALELSLALAEGLNGEHAAAAARLDRLIDVRSAAGLGGLELAVLYAERARLALDANDRDAYERFALLAARAGRLMRHPGLVARLQQLVGGARSAAQPVSPELEQSAELTTEMPTLVRAGTGSLFERLDAQPDREHRARCALEILVRDAHAGGGYLFGATEDGVQLLASAGLPTPDIELERNAAALIASANRDRAAEDETRIESVAVASASGDVPTAHELEHYGRALQPFVLRDAALRGGQALGVVLLARRADGGRPFIHYSVLCEVCERLANAGDLRTPS